MGCEVSCVAFKRTAMGRKADMMIHSALTKEVAGMIERQSPTPEGNPKPPTLTSCLRRAFAAKLGGHISENVGKMWAILSSTGFDEVDDEKLVKIVRGEEIEGGMKRIF